MGIGRVGGDIGEETLDLGMQAWLVGLDREQVIGAVLDNGLGDGWVAGDRVDGDQGTGQHAGGSKTVEQFGNGGDLIGSFGDRLLAEHQLLSGGERREEM